jgi:hypothetical protein
MPRKKYSLILSVPLVAAVAAGAFAAAPSSHGASSESPAGAEAQPPAPTPSMLPGPEELRRYTSQHPVEAEPEPTGPELSMTKVERIALATAAAAEEPSPTAVTAREGRFGPAQLALDETKEQGAGGVTAAQEDAIAGKEPNPTAETTAPQKGPKVPWEDNTVFVVTMHGHFKLVDARRPPGQPAPEGVVMALLIDAHTGWVYGGYVGNAAPNLENIGGTATELDGPPRA